MRARCGPPVRACASASKSTSRAGRSNRMSNPVMKLAAARLRLVLWGAALLALAAPPARVQAQIQAAKGAAHSAQVDEFMKRLANNPFNLNAAAPNVLLAVNQFQCAVRNNGDT